jgi:hypothetical protein
VKEVPGVVKDEAVAHDGAAVAADLAVALDHEGSRRLWQGPGAGGGVKEGGGAEAGGAGADDEDIDVDVDITVDAGIDGARPHQRLSAQTK